MKPIKALADISASYDVLFCDVWGVVHNGEKPYPLAGKALAAARKAGLKVVLVTNSPRPNDGVIAQLGDIGVDPNAWDAVVTSGDATRKLIAEGPPKIMHIGPARELNLYDGLGVELVEEAEAEGICCTGLYDDENETPEQYAGLLARLATRNLPFICANPDIIVHRGSRLIYCAGALARDYASLGGKTLIAGKPHAPIYEAALSVAEKLIGHSVAKSKILAIGDGMPTDIKGAYDFGIDPLFITGGIHFEHYGSGETSDGMIDRAKLATFVTEQAMSPVANMVLLA
jgi:HAD superfamily hydrolase (TIGR01459 family)